MGLRTVLSQLWLLFDEGHRWEDAVWYLIQQHADHCLELALSYMTFDSKMWGCIKIWWCRLTFFDTVDLSANSWLNLDCRTGGNWCLPQSFGRDTKCCILEKLNSTKGIWLPKRPNFKSYCLVRLGWRPSDNQTCILTQTTIFCRTSTNLHIKSTWKHGSTCFNNVSTAVEPALAHFSWIMHSILTRHAASQLTHCSYSDLIFTQTFLITFFNCYPF